MKRALVTIGGGYGSVLLATPVVAAVRELGYETDLLIESSRYDAATMLSGWDAVETFYLDRVSLRRNEGSRGYTAVVRTARHDGPPLHLGPEFRPAKLAAGAHEAEVNFSAARALGYDEPMPPVHVEAQEPICPLPARFLVVAPGCERRAGQRHKLNAWSQWPALCKALHRRLGLQVVLLGEEDERAAWMGAHPEWLHDLYGHTSVRSAAGVIAASDGVVGVVNVLAHMGAALGKPVTAICARPDDTTTAPLGESVRLLEPVDVARLDIEEMLEAISYEEMSLAV